MVEKLDIDKLREMQISSLKWIQTEGEKHLKYFHNTMHLFKNPEKRIKTFDTIQYERFLPEIAKILREKENGNA